MEILNSQAAKFMPKNPEVWEAMAYIYVQQGKRADAVKTLYAGHRYFRKKPHRETAVKFLRKAFAIEPWNFEVTLELARLVKKNDLVEAMGLLEGLSQRVKGRDLVRVRSAMFLTQPGFSMAWKWMKAVI
jgi:Flp pilus assembly protein TadD